MCCPVFETVISRSAKPTASGQTYGKSMNLQDTTHVLSVYRASMRRKFTIFSYFLSPGTDVNLTSWLCHFLCGYSLGSLCNANDKKVVNKLVLLNFESLFYLTTVSCHFLSTHLSY